MNRFKINNPDQEAYYEPTTDANHWYDIGSFVDISWVGKPVRKITVAYL